MCCALTVTPPIYKYLDVKKVEGPNKRGSQRIKRLVNESTRTQMQAFSQFKLFKLFY